MMWSSRLRLTKSTMVARVVDLPEPVGPVTSTRPLLRKHRSSTSFDSPIRSEEHTSELQSPCNLVCRLLLEKKKHLLARPLAPTSETLRHAVLHDVPLPVPRRISALIFILASSCQDSELGIVVDR